jgi:hypothetical protein
MEDYISARLNDYPEEQVFWFTKRFQKFGVSILLDGRILSSRPSS